MIDSNAGAALFRVGHEVRSVTRPLYTRPLIDRNAAISNAKYMPHREAWAPAFQVK